MSKSGYHVIMTRSINPAVMTRTLNPVTSEKLTPLNTTSVPQSQSASSERSAHLGVHALSHTDAF